MATFHEISAKDFTEAMGKIGFALISLPNVFELVFERRFEETRFSIRVYSSVSAHSGMTREKGSDAIRVMIHDYDLDVDAPISVVKRTQNALTNLVVRCREAFVWKNAHKCKCGAIMAVRDGKRGKFLGCSAFPKTKCGETKPWEGGK